MKTFRLFVLVAGCIFISNLVSAQNLQFSGSNNGSMSGKGGLTVDVEKTNLNAAVKIFSFENAVYVVVSDVTSFNGTVAVFNLNGQVVGQQKIDNRNMVKMDLPNLPKGMYVVKAVVNNKVFNQKVYIR
jgi:hypothetical protein